MSDAEVCPGAGGMLAANRINGGGADADRIAPDRLAELADEYLAVSAIRSRVARILFPDVVDALGRMPQLSNDDMSR